MPTRAIVEIVIADNDAEGFWPAFRQFAAARGTQIIGEPRLTRFSEQLKDLGLPTGLNSTLTRPPFNITGVDALLGWSEDRLYSMPGVGPASVRRINLALAKRGLFLQGNELIDPDDMVERLDLNPEFFWALIKNGYRRLSDLVTRDRVEMQSVVPLYALEFALVGLGLELADLSPERHLGELWLDDYAEQTFTLCGLGSETQLGELSAAVMRDSLARRGEAEYGIDGRIDWVRSALARYGFTLPD